MVERENFRVAGAPPGHPVEVFLSCAEEDNALRDELVVHLAPLITQGTLGVWHRGKIGAGEVTKRAVEEHLNSAFCVLLLVSARYLASDECMFEATKAMTRCKPGAPAVVPVLLSDVDWTSAIFGSLEPLPRNRRPVMQWSSRDEAWQEVVRGVRAHLDELAKKRSSMPPPPSGGAPIYPDLLTRALSERLQTAYDRKARLEEIGHDTDAITNEIIDLKRQLRAAGQLKAGDVLGNGRYLLMNQIGRGGFALVWRARDMEKRCDVAVKVLRPDLAADPIRRERFLRGARVMNKLRHPSIVRVFDVPPNDMGWHYYVMEYVRGGDLREAVIAGQLGLPQTLTIILSVTGALAEVHSARWVHRDVKPANILLTEEGHPKLTDFDLVGGPETTGGTTGPLGSLVYAAPELLNRPQEADARADVYSLGMTTLFALYAVGEDWPNDILRREHAQTLIQKLGCSDAVKRVLSRAVKFEAAERFKDAAAYREALAHAINSPATPVGGNGPEHTFDDVTAQHRAIYVAPPVTVRPAAMVDVTSARTEKITFEPPPRREPPLLKITDAYLVTINAPPGTRTNEKLLFPDNPTRIGRDPPSSGTGIVLSHGSISRVHARIELRGFSLVLIDEDSTNGTFVTPRSAWTERDRVSGLVMLHEGYYISFGAEFMFHLELRPYVGSDDYMREFERLKIDATTGLFSRRYLDWCIDRDALSAQQRHQSLALLVLRVTKRPELSSDAIDGLLADLAQLVLEQGTGGLIGRFGRLSIGVLLKGKTAASARELGLEIQKQAPSAMSVRFGAAEILPEDKDPAEALRNRIVAAMEVSPDEDEDF